MRSSAIWLHHEQRLIEKQFRCFKITGKPDDILSKKIALCRQAMYNALDYETTK